jgi:alanyl-tRNA synthetase
VKATEVSFPAGEATGQGVVQGVVDVDGLPGVITDNTPFHPVDPAWPDQPADTGTLDGRPVVDCLLGAVAQDGTVTVGEQIAVRRGDPDHTWVVVHRVDGAAPSVGEVVNLQVDSERRNALSRAHTACHVVALALNAALAQAWRKEVARDGIGNPDFDRLALTESRMTPDAARDTYRLGKSLRKKGFDSAALTSDPESIASIVNQTVQRWIDADGRVDIEVTGPGITDMRYWCCQVPEGTYRIACGGTHVSSLAELGAVDVRYEFPDDATVVAVTTVTPAAG